jgi:hypothetical protein
LIYRLETDAGLQFQDPKARDFETPAFDLRLEDGRLMVTMKEHYASADEARHAVKPFLDAWEIDWALRRGGGRREMRFVYEQSNVVDRQPPPAGTTVINAKAAYMAWTGMEAHAVVSVPIYPAPPSGFQMSADVETLWNRFEQYIGEREPLAGMAYACLTFITKVMYNGRDEASKELNISDPMLKELGRLAGGKGERKYPTGGAYSNREKAWLEAAIRLLILRVGEQAAGVPVLRQITMTDPDLPTGGSVLTEASGRAGEGCG